MKATDQTLVLFRQDSEGCTAFMPLEPADVNGYYCTCYAHIGQHSSADLSGCIDRSRPSTPEEYASLKRELESLGYNVKVGRKTPRNALDVRRSKLARTALAAPSPLS